MRKTIMCFILFVFVSFSCDLTNPGGTDKDTIAPEINNNIVWFTDLTGDSVKVNWISATDNLTIQDDLSYRVSKGKSNLTITDVVMDWTKMATSCVIQDLTKDEEVFIKIEVKDTSGNISVYDLKSFIPSIDSEAPTVNDPKLEFSLISDSSLTINWNESLDNKTDKDNIMYKVYFSLENNIDSIQDIKINGTLVAQPLIGISTINVTNLTANTTYYFNLIASDQSGNETIYSQNEVKTQYATTGTIENVSYYIAGSTIDSTGDETEYGLALMGGGSRVQQAFEWMQTKAGGGDLLVLTTAEIDTAFVAWADDIKKIGFNSVIVLRINSSVKANTSFVYTMIKRAEAIYMDVGDQAKYYNYFKGSRVYDAIDELTNTSATKRVPIGGASAGLHMLGGFAYIPATLAVYWDEALANPYNIYMNNVKDDMFAFQYMTGVLTESHFSQRTRAGRVLGMSARLIQDGRVSFGNTKAIAVDEATALCVDKDGIGVAYGLNYVFMFNAISEPDTCESEKLLVWRDGMRAYRIKGSTVGAGSFNMTTWTGTGGAWYLYDIEGTTKPTENSKESDLIKVTAQ